MIKSTST